MKKNIRKILIIFWAVVLVIIIARAPRVGAEEEPARSTVTVQLTAAQTLALFGQSFNALYYNNGIVENVTFEFVKSSRTIVDDVSACFGSWSVGDTTETIVPDGAKNCFTLYAPNTRGETYFDHALYTNSEWLGSNGGSVIDRDKLLDYEFLLYKCVIGHDVYPVSSQMYDFQFNIYFPFALSGVDSWQSIFCTQLGTYGASSSFGLDPAPIISNTNLGSEIRLYSSNNPIVPVGVTSDTHSFGDNTRFGYALHPINTCDPSLSTGQIPGYAALDDFLSYFGIFSFQILDESFSASTDLTSVSWNIRNIEARFAFQSQGFDPSLSHDPDVPWDPMTCYVMVMCPRLRGEFSIGRPSGSGSYIDYTESLDKLISGSDATNNKLDIIIQKLNQIYNEMVADNGGVDLVEPEVIGFTQQQKQQILDGVSSLDSAMDNLSPEDLPTETIGGFFDIWDRITNIIPPGLMAIYVFALVGGIASWVIFSGRGG